MTQATQVDTNDLKGNTASFRSRRWVFTLNNWSSVEHNTLTQYFKENCVWWIIGKEIGDNGTPHLQGYFDFKNAKSMKTLKKINSRLHLEKAKGTIEENRIYCSKQGDFETNIMNVEETLLKLQYSNVKWKEWQQSIIDIIETNPHPRRIYWYWDQTGNIGKSFVCKYISMKYDALICSGKTNDIFNQTMNWRTVNPMEVQIPPCIIDVPRSDFAHINYAAIEQLKNGFLYSGKYEGGKIHGLPPHVIIFANSPPDYTQMSEDRFKEVNLD